MAGRGKVALYQDTMMATIRCYFFDEIRIYVE